MRRFRWAWFGTFGVVLSFVAAQSFLPVMAQAADLTNGKKIYEAKCLRCHGKEGKGDGPKAADLKKPPADYTKPGFLDQFTDGKLKEQVLEGNEPMPSFKRRLKDNEIDDVIAYIRTFARKK